MHDLGEARAYGIGFSRDGQRIYHATLTDLCCTEAETGQKVWQTRLSENANFNAGIAESFDGNWVAVVLPPYSVCWLDARSGALLARVEHPDLQPINDIGFSPDGNWFAVACTSHVTQLWDLKRLRAELSAMKAGW
jgi:WD40 repeat protein